jgi:hypothetical protein
MTLRCMRTQCLAHTETGRKKSTKCQILKRVFRVKKWITFNEPLSFTWLGYGTGIHAPGRYKKKKKKNHA